jgi:PAS domain S-box-containing protein
MKGKLGSDINEDMKKSSFIENKQGYLPYDVQLLSILNDAVIITDENFVITYWNPSSERIYGMKSSEVLGDDLQNVLKTKHLGTKNPGMIEQLIKTGSYQDDVVQFTKKDFPLYMSIKVSAITNNDGIVKGYISINRDMTRQKNIEKKFKRSYNLLKSIIENTDDSIYLKNLNGNYIMANNTVSEIVGKPMSDIIGNNDWDLFSYDEAESIVKSDKEIITSKKTLNYEETLYSHREGEIRCYLSIKGPYMGNGKVLGTFGITRDITHLKTAERKLKKSEKQYRTLFETMVQGVVYHDKNGCITAMNPASEQILGYTLKEIQGRTSEDPIWEAIHPDGTVFNGEDHPSMIALKTGLEVSDVVMGIKYPNKEGYTWLNIHAVPQFHNGEKEPYQVCTTFEDITNQKKSKDMILKSEVRYRSLFNEMTEGFALHRIVLNEFGEPSNYRFLDINHAFEELTGLKRDDIIGKLKTEVFPEDNDDWIRIYGKVAITGRSIHFDKYSESLQKYYNILAYSPAPNQFAVLFTDITERKNIEKELKETVKKLQSQNTENVDDNKFIFTIRSD